MSSINAEIVLCWARFSASVKIVFTIRYNCNMQLQQINDRLFSIEAYRVLFSDKIKWKVVFFVKSSATNYERRSSIRETWGAVKVYRSALIKVVFIVGTVQLQTRLNQEIKDFKDILLIDMEESSRYFLALFSKSNLFL